MHLNISSVLDANSDREVATTARTHARTNSYTHTHTHTHTPTHKPSHTHTLSLLVPGLLQFQTSPPGDGLISPALEPARVSVSEEAGEVRLLVGRAQGLLGRLTVGYRTTPFTAASPEDYEVIRFAAHARCVFTRSFLT